jgi:hypothetical protein
MSIAQQAAAIIAMRTDLAIVFSLTLDRTAKDGDEDNPVRGVDRVISLRPAPAITP